MPETLIPVQRPHVEELLLQAMKLRQRATQGGGTYQKWDRIVVALTHALATHAGGTAR